MKLSLLVVLASILSGCSQQFQVGDCFIPTFKQEKWETPWHIERVEEIGDSSYRVKWYTPRGEWVESEFGVGFDQTNNVKKVVCPSSKERI